MKKLSVFLCAMVLVFGVAGTANSALIDCGGGLIYDDVLDITWLQDLSLSPTFVDGWQAKKWAEDFMYTSGGVLYSSWRLPTYVEMMSLNRDYGISSLSPGPFDRSGYDAFRLATDIGIYYYYDDFPTSGAYYTICQVAGPPYPWIPNSKRMYLGEPGHATWGAVFDGAPVPIPSAIWLFGVGIFGLIGFRRKFGKA